MGKIYLNGKDREILINIKNKLDNVNEINVINRLLEQEENNRLHFNSITCEYKKRRRAENKDFARSKKEINNRKLKYN